MPTITFEVIVEVSVSEEGANVNEVLHAVEEARQSFGTRLAEGVIQWLDERVRTRLCAEGAKAPPSWSYHKSKRDPSHRCVGRRFVREGFRQQPRHLKTDLGDLRFSVGYVRCQCCGKKFAPVLQALEIGSRQRHALELERLVVEATNRTSFARSVEEIEGLTGVPTSKSSHHRWAAGLRLPEVEALPFQQLMADGTKYKKAGGKRGELRLAIGITGDKRVVGLGTWSGKDWSDIGTELKRKLSHLPRVPVAVVDGEIGLDRHVASLADTTQRSKWHLLRDMRNLLWHDRLNAAQTAPFQKRLAGILAVEIPEGEWEAILPITRERLSAQVANARREFQAMVAEFGRMGYSHGEAYLQGALDRIFSRIDLWLKTGIIAPKSTGIIEEIMREVGRRIKKLGWNWLDHGATQQAAMILLRRYSQEQWQNYWQQRLGLRGHCQIVFRSFNPIR